MGKIVGEIYAGCTMTVKNAILGGTMKTSSNYTAVMLRNSIGCASDTSQSTLSGVVFTAAKYGSNDISRDTGSNKVEGSPNVTGTPVKITDASIKGDKNSSGLGNGLDAYWVSNSDVNGYALPLDIFCNL